MIAQLTSLLALSSIVVATPFHKSEIDSVIRKRDFSSGATYPAMGQSCKYAVLATSGISTVPNSHVNGPIGVSPIAITAITGFSLSAGQGPSSSSQIVGGMAHAPESSDGKSPTGSPQAVSDMGVAYGSAANQGASSDSNLVGLNSPYALTYTNAFGGQIPAGTYLKKGVYRWGSTVVLAGDIYLEGNCGDVFILHATGAISTAAGQTVHLSGTLTAASVFWVTATVLTTGAGSNFVGNIMTGTNSVIGTGGSLTGLAQIGTQIALHQATVNMPNFNADCSATCATATLQPVPYIATCSLASSALATAHSCYQAVASAYQTYAAAAYAANVASQNYAATTNSGNLFTSSAAAASASSALGAIENLAAKSFGEECAGGFVGAAAAP